MGSIKKIKHSDRPGAVQGTGEEDVLVCVNVAMTKTALKVAVCALPTDVAYNRCECVGMHCACACVCTLDVVTLGRLRDTSRCSPRRLRQVAS